jgi:hypoxanthine-guanine phosphoribosyltransferase
MQVSPNTTIDDLLKLIYGKDVVENAYASPAGRLTKKEAKTQLESLLTAAYEHGYDDRTLEADHEIEEAVKEERNKTLLLIEEALDAGNNLESVKEKLEQL